MAPRNRDLGTSQAVPAIHGFAPGGDSFDVLRTLDGHMPNENGYDGANPHNPTAPAMEWDETEPYWPCGDSE